MTWSFMQPVKNIILSTLNTLFVTRRLMQCLPARVPQNIVRGVCVIHKNYLLSLGVLRGIVQYINILKYRGNFYLANGNNNSTGWIWRSNPGGGEIFRPHLDRSCLLYSGYRVSFPGVKRPGRGVNHPLLYSAEVKERVELYLYTPSGSSRPVIG